MPRKNKRSRRHRHKEKKGQGLSHKAACQGHKLRMRNEHGYVFCESKHCDDPNKNFPPHSSHHIMSAGRWPRHKELHNPLNLIMLCHKCHTEFHGNKRKEEHEQLVAERGLDKLFRR